MNNKLLGIVGIIAIIILGGVVLMSPSKQDILVEIKTERSPEPTGSNTTTMVTRYFPYEKNTFDTANGTKKVLFFYANWCPTCKPADSDFTQQMLQIPEDIVLIRVNYNDAETEIAEKELADRYQVTYQHTFVQIDETGKEITRWTGGKMTELLSNVK